MLKNLNIKDKLKDKKFSLQFYPDAVKNITTTEYVFYNGKKIKSSHIIDIVHNLLLRYYFKKENKFNLSSLILKEKYGYLYNYYMEFLVHHEIIYLDKEYRQGKNARIYKLCERIIHGNISRYKNSDKTLLKKYKKAVSSIDNNDIKTNSILPEIKQKLVSDLFSVSIEFDKAMYFLDNTKQDADCYSKNKYSVESIRDKHIFYHFDIYGRVHTNFTILKSFIRKNCLLLNGEETYEIDISNSQPLFLSKLIHQEGIGINEHEFKVFSYLVIHGKFYQFLMDNSTIKEKKECKEFIYKTLFGRNNSDEGNPFALLFPSIYRFIIDYKESYGDYRVLAHKLQNEESNFIFNNVVKNLTIINPDINFVTIHDSIIVQAKYKEQADKVMLSLLYKEFDFIDTSYKF